MLKKCLAAIFILSSLVILVGCSTTVTETTSPANVNTVRETKLSPNWALKQMEVNLGSETKIMLTLADGDKVDGYFYLTSGDNVSFSISGTSLIYESKAPGTGAKSVASDRFSFTASQTQGTAYTLKLTPVSGTEGRVEAAVFLELIYPVTGELFVPFGTK